MDVEIQIIKDIPAEQISNFEDRTVYNCAVYTREYTKTSNSYPYLSGKLMATEVAAPIVGSNKEYGLTAGVGYATYVYKMNNPKWTNKNTQPHWYMTNYKSQGKNITTNAVKKALQEV